MNRLFRRPEPGKSDRAALLAFALIYVFALVLVLAPETFLGT
ncbi:hypothetical protein [Tabrizicola fusiformis]|nr:hypothetical protein [Tabrizicola sp. SY72]